MANRQIAIHHFPFPLCCAGLSMDVPVFQFFFQTNDDVVFDWRQSVACIADWLSNFVSKNDIAVRSFFTIKAPLMHQAMMETT